MSDTTPSNSFTLQFDTIEAAIGEDKFYREKLDIREEDDDVAAMKSGSQPKEWVRKFVQAFSHDYIKAQEGVTKSDAQIKYFIQWQELAQLSVENAREMKDPNHLERCCWYLFDAVIKTHEKGASKVGNKFECSKLKCSARLAAIVSIIEKFALVRKELLHLDAINQIAADPEGFIHRRLSYQVNNANRAIAKQKKRAEAEEKQRTEAKDEDKVGEGNASAADAALKRPQRAPRVRRRGKAKQVPSSAEGNVASQAPDDTEAAAIDDISKKCEGKGKVQSSAKDKNISSIEDNEPLPSQTLGENEAPVVGGTSNKGNGKGKAPFSATTNKPAPSQTPGGIEVTAVDGTNKKPKDNRKAKRARSATLETDVSNTAVKKDDMLNKRVAHDDSSVATDKKARGGRKPDTGGPKAKK